MPAPENTKTKKTVAFDQKGTLKACLATITQDKGTVDGVEKLLASEAASNLIDFSEKLAEILKRPVVIISDTVATQGVRFIKDDKESDDEKESDPVMFSFSRDVFGNIFYFDENRKKVIFLTDAESKASKDSQALEARVQVRLDQFLQEKKWKCIGDYNPFLILEGLEYFSSRPTSSRSTIGGGDFKAAPLFLLQRRDSGENLYSLLELDRTKAKGLEVLKGFLHPSQERPTYEFRRNVQADTPQIEKKAEGVVTLQLPISQTVVQFGTPSIVAEVASTLSSPAAILLPSSPSHVPIPELSLSPTPALTLLVSDLKLGTTNFLMNRTLLSVDTASKVEDMQRAKANKQEFQQLFDNVEKMSSSTTLRSERRKAETKAVASCKKYQEFFGDPPIGSSYSVDPRSLAAAVLVEIQPTLNNLLANTTWWRSIWLTKKAKEANAADIVQLQKMKELCFDVMNAETEQDRSAKLQDLEGKLGYNSNALRLGQSGAGLSPASSPSPSFVLPPSPVIGPSMTPRPAKNQQSQKSSLIESTFKKALDAVATLKTAAESRRQVRIYTAVKNLFARGIALDLERGIALDPILKKISEAQFPSAFAALNLPFSGAHSLLPLVNEYLNVKINGGPSNELADRAVDVIVAGFQAVSGSTTVMTDEQLEIAAKYFAICAFNSFAHVDVASQIGAYEKYVAGLTTEEQKTKFIGYVNQSVGNLVASTLSIMKTEGLEKIKQICADHHFLIEWVKKNPQLKFEQVDAGIKQLFSYILQQFNPDGQATPSSLSWWRDALDNPLVKSRLEHIRGQDKAEITKFLAELTNKYFTWLVTLSLNEGNQKHLIAVLTDETSFTIKIGGDTSTFKPEIAVLLHLLDYWCDSAKHPKHHIPTENDFKVLAEIFQHNPDFFNDARINNRINKVIKIYIQNLFEAKNFTDLNTFIDQGYVLQLGEYKYGTTEEQIISAVLESQQASGVLKSLVFPTKALQPPQAVQSTLVEGEVDATNAQLQLPHQSPGEKFLAALGTYLLPDSVFEYDEAGVKIDRSYGKAKDLSRLLSDDSFKAKVSALGGGDLQKRTDGLFELLGVVDVVNKILPKNIGYKVLADVIEAQAKAIVLSFGGEVSLATVQNSINDFWKNPVVSKMCRRFPALCEVLIYTINAKVNERVLEFVKGLKNKSWGAISDNDKTLFLSLLSENPPLTQTLPPDVVSQCLYSEEAKKALQACIQGLLPSGDVVCAQAIHDQLRTLKPEVRELFLTPQFSAEILQLLIGEVGDVNDKGDILSEQAQKKVAQHFTIIALFGTDEEKAVAQELMNSLMKNYVKKVNAGVDPQTIAQSTAQWCKAIEQIIVGSDGKTAGARTGVGAVVPVCPYDKFKEKMECLRKIRLQSSANFKALCHFPELLDEISIEALKYRPDKDRSSSSRSTTEEVPSASPKVSQTLPVDIVQKQSSESTFLILPWQKELSYKLGKKQVEALAKLGLGMQGGLSLSFSTQDSTVGAAASSSTARPSPELTHESLVKVIQDLAMIDKWRELFGIPGKSCFDRHEFKVLIEENKTIAEVADKIIRSSEAWSKQFIEFINSRYNNVGGQVKGCPACFEFTESAEIPVFLVQSELKKILAAIDKLSEQPRSKEDNGSLKKLKDKVVELLGRESIRPGDIYDLNIDAISSIFPELKKLLEEKTPYELACKLQENHMPLLASMAQLASKDRDRTSANNQMLEILHAKLQRCSDQEMVEFFKKYGRSGEDAVFRVVKGKTDEIEIKKMLEDAQGQVQALPKQGDGAITRTLRYVLRQEASSAQMARILLKADSQVALELLGSIVHSLGDEKLQGENRKILEGKVSELFGAVISAAQDQGEPILFNVAQDQESLNPRNRMFREYIALSFKTTRLSRPLIPGPDGQSPIPEFREVLRLMNSEDIESLAYLSQKLKLEGLNPEYALKVTEALYQACGNEKLRLEEVLKKNTVKTKETEEIENKLEDLDLFINILVNAKENFKKPQKKPLDGQPSLFMSQSFMPSPAKPVAANSQRQPPDSRLESIDQPSSANTTGPHTSALAEALKAKAARQDNAAEQAKAAPPSPSKKREYRRTDSILPSPATGSAKGSSSSMGARAVGHVSNASSKTRNAQPKTVSEALTQLGELVENKDFKDFALQMSFGYVDNHGTPAQKLMSCAILLMLKPDVLNALNLGSLYNSKELSGYFLQELREAATKGEDAIELSKFLVTEECKAAVKSSLESRMIHVDGPGVVETSASTPKNQGLESARSALSAVINAQNLSLFVIDKPKESKQQLKLVMRGKGDESPGKKAVLDHYELTPDLKYPGQVWKSKAGVQPLEWSLNWKAGEKLYNIVYTPGAGKAKVYEAINDADGKPKVVIERMFDVSKKAGFTSEGQRTFDLGKYQEESEKIATAEEEIKSKLSSCSSAEGKIALINGMSSLAQINRLIRGGNHSLPEFVRFNLNGLLDGHFMAGSSYVSSTPSSSPTSSPAGSPRSAPINMPDRLELGSYDTPVDALVLTMSTFDDGKKTEGAAGSALTGPTPIDIPGKQPMAEGTNPFVTSANLIYHATNPVASPVNTNPFVDESVDPNVDASGDTQEQARLDSVASPVVIDPATNPFASPVNTNPFVDGSVKPKCSSQNITQQLGGLDRGKAVFTPPPPTDAGRVLNGWLIPGRETSGNNPPIPLTK